MNANLKKSVLIRLGKRVKALREQINLSQSELANAINKDQQSIQRLESGNINPSFVYLIEVGIGLEVPLAELLNFNIDESK